ncbi:MAG: phosphoribosylaminoimidazolesuccinocarboxamide synthase [Candidatus Gastranaerophilaceae bacterium]|jgi:phosphoribosylaminoimidazole-succinocarboxamide synthase
MQMIYEGKAKQVYSCEKSDQVIIHFKDDATAFNGVKKDIFSGKGLINFAFSKHFFKILNDNGIKSHFIAEINDTSFKATKVKIIPLEVVIRNYAAGSICKRINCEKGYKFTTPLVEFFLKDDAKGDPLLSKQEIIDQNLAKEEEIIELASYALKINEILSDYLYSKDIILVDFKLEFGKNINGRIILADEISPDTCRFWKKDTMESLDKDVYREDKGNLVDTYKKIAEIVGVSYEL